MYPVESWSIMNVMKRIAAGFAAALASLVLVVPAADARPPAKCRVVGVETVTLFDPTPTPQLATVTMTTWRCRGDLVVVVAISYRPA